MNLDRWVPYRSDGPVGCRVFCFPHAAGNATFYRPLRQAMAGEIDFCPIELPGRAARIGERPIPDIDVLLDTLARTIQPLMAVPFAFFGHSTGAAIAYQAARRLRAADGRRAVHLFVSARAAAGLGRSDPPLHTLSDGALRSALQRYGGTPDAVLACDELITALLPTMRADLALADLALADSSAGTKERLVCPITAFGGAADTIDVPSLEAWRACTSGAFRLRLFPGGHFYLTKAGTMVADEIAGDLAASAGLTVSPRMRQMAEAG